MIARSLVFLFLTSIAAGCGSSSNDGSTPAGGEVTAGHTLTLSASLASEGGQASFLTPTVNVVKVPVESIVGKPYLVALYNAGFSPGNDAALEHVWGKVPADLKITYSTSKRYADGPYDMVLVVYAGTP